MMVEVKLMVAVLCAVAIVAAQGVAFAGAARLPRAEISPILVRLMPGAEQRFSVSAEGRAARVSSWRVNDVPGGNDALGRITPGGVYHAPKQAPAPCEVHIGAVAEGVENGLLFSTVLVGRGEPSFRLAQRWGERGEGAGQFGEPHGIAVDGDGHLLICDPERSRVLRFTEQGKLLGELGLGPGSQPGAFAGPPDIAVDGGGNIFVLDRKNGRVQEFAADGKLTRYWGEEGCEAGQVARPHSIAIGNEGRIYIADTDNARVQVFDREGKCLGALRTEFAGSGKFKAPHGLGVDGNGDVIVADYWDGLQKFAADGRAVFTIATGGEHCHAMCMDRWGDVYLMARHPVFGSTIVKYNNNGALVTRWAPATEVVKSFAPKCATVDANGRLCLTEADGQNMAVDVLEPE